MDEVSLIKSLQQGNSIAFQELYRLYSDQALRTAYLITGNKELSEDVVQEAFIRCYKDLHKLKDPVAFKAWFYRILTHLCLRMKPKEKQHVSIDEMRDMGYEICQNEWELADTVEANELQKVVWQAVNQLEPVLKTVIVLYYFNELSIKEIAKMMQCFEGTVKSRLYHGRKRLMKIIDLGNPMKAYSDIPINRKGNSFYEKASLL